MSFDLFNDQTSQGLQYALNSLSLREQVVSQNIANAQTPGYVAQDVNFQGTLDQIMSGAQQATPAQTGTVVNAPDVSARQDGNTVSLESEMGRQNQTTTLYNTLTQLMTDRMQILKTAITG